MGARLVEISETEALLLIEQFSEKWGEEGGAECPGTVLRSWNAGPMS